MRAVEDAEFDAEESLLAREQAEVLHAEIERLPRAFRLPVVLCYFEGLTVHEAARRMRCSHGTVRSRLARAREKLGARLTPPRRGRAGNRAGRGSVSARARQPRSHPICAKRQRAPRSPSRPASPPRRCGVAGPGGPTIHDVSQVEVHLAYRALARRSRHERRLSEPLWRGTTIPNRPRPASKRRDAANPKARSRPHVRGRPRARSARQTGAGRNRDGLRSGQVLGDCDRFHRVPS